MRATDLIRVIPGAAGCAPVRAGIVGALLALLFVLPAPAAERAERAELPEDLTELALEDLMNIEVTSAGRKEQKLSDTSAAVYVITREDIRRSGVTSIPEALRMVPGIQVAQIDSSKWAISARGFNARYANKMLVLIDGRTVYTPLYSGVYWDAQDLMLEDVERIEVIRGPGATLWGANAVNGVINIITRNARDTTGPFLSATFGTEEQPLGGIRFGGEAGENGHYRVYAKYFDRAALRQTVGSDTIESNDQWDSMRAGFRYDREVAGEQTLTLHGDVYNEDAHQRLTTFSLDPPFTRTFDDVTKVSGGSLVGRWSRTAVDGSQIGLQMSFDRSKREDALLGEERDTWDLDFQHRFTLGSHHEIVWGLGYRYTTDEIQSTDVVTFDPASRSDDVFSAFIQDDITSPGGAFRLTIGSKFENNDYSGFEVQPNVRALWKLGPSHTMWGAVSRALRTPSRAWHDVRLNAQAIPGGFGPTILVAAFGDEDFDSEELIAYEMGHRWRPADAVAIDTALFYNAYDKLLTAEPGEPFFEPEPAPAHIVAPLVFDNKMKGHSYGAEIATTWKVMRPWSLSASYSWLRLQLEPYDTSASQGSADQEGDNPRHQIHMRSNLDLPRNFSFDTSVYHVSKLSNLDVPSYTRVDLRFGWSPLKGLEASVGVRNLLDDRHREFASGVDSLFTEVSDIKRSYYGRLEWQF